ncbi:MAG: invasion associated locus B family protein [Alphaproteobacteria bacterium]
MRTAFALAALCLAATAATAQTVRETDRIHQDWREACESRSGGELCFIFQRLQHQGRAAANVTIGYKPGVRGPVAVFNLPLGAVALPDGLRLESDKDVDAWAPFLFCSERGCHAELELEQRLLAALRAGAKADVIVRELGGREIRLEMSLLGLTAGLDALKR